MSEDSDKPKNAKDDDKKKNELREKIAKQRAEKFFYLFMMPMLLLTVRLEIDVIF